MRARYNIAPAQMIPIVRQLHGPLDFYRWGLIPAWEKAREKNVIPTGYINARIETVSEKPSFKRAFQSQRCVIPASGYYEWKTMGARKQPYYVSFTHHPIIGLAGILSRWKSEEGLEYQTCAILTQEAPQSLKGLHARCPVILQQKCYKEWLSLNNSIKDNIFPLLFNPDNEKVSIHAVTPRMNKTDFDFPECIMPL